MHALIALSFGPGVAPAARSHLVSRARTALAQVEASAGRGVTGRLHADDNHSESWVGMGIDDEFDLWEPDAGRFALMLCRGPYTTDGSALTGATLLSRLAVDDAVLAEMASPISACLRRGKDGPIEMLTDVCGLRHVYVRRGHGWVAAGTSSLALALLEPTELDEESVLGFALAGNYDGTRTPYRNVAKIPNGCRAVLRAGDLAVDRYLDEDLHPAPGSDAELIREGVETLTALVEGACSSQAGPPTLELSGGLDSRGLLAALTPSRRRQARMLTLGTPEQADWRVATELARQVGAEHQFVDLRTLSTLSPQESWQLVERSAVRHDASSGAVATGVLDWVEAQVPQGPRFNGINGEYGRGRFYAGQRSGPLTAKRVERLARWRVFANDAADPWLFAPGVIEDARTATVGRLQEEFAGYGTDWLRATDDHFLYGRMQRWCGIDFSASCLDRPILAPYFCTPFLVWARRLDEDQKRSSRLFSAVIEAMSPDLAEVPLVTGVSPKDLARPSTGTRVRQQALAARRISRKVRQRLTPGTDTPPVGAASLSSQVLSWWTANPGLLDPLTKTPWLDASAVKAVAEGARIPSASSVGFLANLLVIATSMAAEDVVAVTE
jgi:asparagine synthase (glutamine-hydrolysing)